MLDAQAKLIEAALGLLKACRLAPGPGQQPSMLGLVLLQVLALACARTVGATPVGAIVFCAEM